MTDRSRPPCRGAADADGARRSSLRPICAIVEAMRAAVAGQEVVFNLAGQSGAVQSMQDPWTDLDVNCRGNLVLLDALRAR